MNRPAVQRGGITVHLTCIGATQGKERARLLDSAYAAKHGRDPRHARDARKLKGKTVSTFASRKQRA